MIFNNLFNSDVIEISLERLGDERGFFARSFCIDEFHEQGLITNWQQMNSSFTSKKGSLRGLHFQRAPNQEAKLIRAIRGTVFDVAVDLRKNSPNFGTAVSIILSSETGNSVYIPEGFAHGFQTLNEDVEMLYCHSARYAPELEGGVNPLDPAIAISWPLPISSISDRDHSLPKLRNVDAL
jgi:dTDP-4-dehydrorhamnose 3,5-epimerase